MYENVFASTIRTLGSIQLCMDMSMGIEYNTITTRGYDIS